jgi:hypothetical protein
MFSFVFSARRDDITIQYLSKIVSISTGADGYDFEAKR